MNYESVLGEKIGIMGTGTNTFRCAIVHSSGIIFIGTYGPEPALIWRYDPMVKELTLVGAPGEYQLDCMVEAPNGLIYIGTAYEALVYELDPATLQIRNLGTPPVDSTPWIFTMICTGDGEIYGAKGVGMFHLDWRTGEMTSCGIVPGDHLTQGPNPSSPIVRSLEERPDGLLWGDTNCWIFTFDSSTRKITLIADIAATDSTVYGISHCSGISPTNELYFRKISRFSGKTSEHSLSIWINNGLEHLDIEEFRGGCGISGWWHQHEKAYLLIGYNNQDEEEVCIAVFDIETRKIVDRWKAEGIREPSPGLIPGPGLWFMSGGRGVLYQADPEQKKLIPMVINPEPVECRSLAYSPRQVLGTDTYDCGYVFTYNLKSKSFVDHGKVTLDDHRCHYGPAAFAGKDGNYLVANHGDGGGWPKLWVTELENNKHWSIGETAIQLLTADDGVVWGTIGETVTAYKFKPKKCWISSWQSKPGKLFRYKPGEHKAEVVEEAGIVGAISPVPGMANRLLLASNEQVILFDTESRQVVHRQAMPGAVKGMSRHNNSKLVYLLLEGGLLYRCRTFRHDGFELGLCAEGFTLFERGFFALPVSGAVVGVDHDGRINVWNEETGNVHTLKGPEPLPAGPAVADDEDAWYYADRFVMKYSIENKGYPKEGD